MAKSEDTTSGTTVAQTKTSAESDQGDTTTSSLRGGREDRGNSMNNTRYSLTSTIKYYKEGVEPFGDVLAVNYQKMELKKSFDVFREKLINYNIKELNGAEDFIVLVQDM